MKRSIYLFVFLSFSFIFANASAFNVSSSFWREGEVEINVNLPDRHSSGTPLPMGSATLAELQTEFVRSMNEWNDNSTFKFVVDTATPAVDPCAMGETRSGVYFGTTDCNNVGLGSSTLGISVSFFNSNNHRTRTYIVFDSDRVWDVFPGTESGKVDFRRVALHELGHSVGLNHEDSGPLTIMESFISPTIRSLQSDDLAGAAFLYDLDNDGVGFADDNCKTTSNADQSNLDGDEDGDACDSDIDGDGVFNDATVDQEFAFSNDSLANSGFSFGAMGTNGYLAQTFTVGLDGKLESVFLPIGCSGDLQIEIRGTSGGVPLATSLDSKTLTTGPADTTYTEIDLNDLDADDLDVNAGDVLSIVAYSTGDCFWPLATSGSYDRGQGYFSINGSSFFVSGSDRPFAVKINPTIFDNCPEDANADQADGNSNGVGDVCDGPDADSDGVVDSVDNCPNDANADQANNDGDSVGDVCDTDDDNDTVLDVSDNCPFIANLSQDNNDTDMQGDACDTDDDNDTVLDAVDNCPFVVNFAQADADGDGDGDACDATFTEQDNDMIADSDDNCPMVSNPGQENNDGDTQGDVCDSDDDNDTVLDGADNCPLNANMDQADGDGDGFGDVCDSEFTEQDSDMVADAEDNCPTVNNADQTNTDGDAEGDACDSDDDNDSIEDSADNCPLVANLLQEDEDNNDVGDACEPMDEEICFPIPSRNSSLAVVCL